MKVLTNHPDQSLIRGVASLLVRSLAAEPGEVFLVSPWLKDVRLPAADVGSFHAALSGDRDEVSLSELIVRIAQRHRLHLITKPPAELVDVQLLRQIREKQATRRRILSDDELSGRDIRDELTAGIEKDLRDLAARATVHVETLRMARLAQSSGADVRFLERLHVKLLWTPQGVLVGSANFTHGGLIANEELMLEVTDSAAHAATREAVCRLADRAIPCDEYRFRKSATAGDDPISAWRLEENSEPDDLRPLTEVVNLIAPFER